MCGNFLFPTPASTEIYTLSLHDALPIFVLLAQPGSGGRRGNEDPSGQSALGQQARLGSAELEDRKSTRLNSSHSQSSYAVFCLKKKNAGLGVPIHAFELMHGMIGTGAAH